MPKPSSVTSAVICWPSGQSLQTNDPNCRQQRRAWILDKTTPPTLRSAEQSMDEQQQLAVWLNRKGERVRPECDHVSQSFIHLWPTVLEPWLPRPEWQENRLPPDSTECPSHRLTGQGKLLISGIKNGATIRKMPEQPVVLNVKTIGGRGNLHWFLDKMWVGKVRNSQTVKIEVPSIGEHTISVIDDKGAFSKSVFSVE